MVGPPPPDPDHQLADVCRALNGFGVAYVVFGSHVARLHGAAVETDDVDVVPDTSPENLRRLADALNSLRPRWRVEGMAGGVKIDGRWLEPRHFQAKSTAVGLETSVGPIDIVLEPRGFEAGYAALNRSAVTFSVAGEVVRVGGLDDLIASKQLLGRDKDLAQLPVLLERQAELARKAEGPQLAPERDVSTDEGLGLDS